MMSTTTRFASMGFVLGLMLSVTASCGTPQGRCNAASCTGCCDARGMCQTGTTPTACGQRGAMCTTCALGQTCGFGGVCSGGGTDNTGGGSGVGGGFGGFGGSGVGGGIGGSGVGGGVGGSGVGGGFGGSGVGGGFGGSGVGGGFGGSGVGGGSGGGTPACNTCLASTAGQLVCVPQGTNLNLTTCGRNGGLCQNCVQQGATACVMGTCQGSSTGGGFPGVGGGSSGGGPATGGGSAGGCIQIASLPSQNFVNGTFRSNIDAGLEYFIGLSVLSADQDAGTGFFGLAERVWPFGSPRPFFPESFTLPFNGTYFTCEHCLSIRFCLLDLSQCSVDGYFALSGSGQWSSGTFNESAGSFSGTIGPTNYIGWNFQTDSPSTTVTDCVDIGSQSFTVTWP